MEEIINEFVCETSEKLDLLDQELLRLEQEPLDHEVVGNIFRMVHTIKGTSGFLGLERLGKLAHASENLLSAMRDGELAPTPGSVSAILKALDVIKGMVNHLAEHQVEPDLDNTSLITNLNSFLTSAQDTPEEGVCEGPEEPVSDETELVLANANENGVPLENGVSGTPLADSESKGEAMPAAVVVPVSTPAAPAAKGVSKGSNLSNSTIRVHVDVLEQLMQTVSELVLNRNQLLQLMRTYTTTNDVFQVPLQQLSYITSELQERMMKTRMQPIGNAWAQLPRIVRDLSQDLGKKIQLKMFGEDTELDRQLLETIKDPLIHMVRNSCDHGVELPADRVAVGKPELGTVTLSAYQEGGHIVVKIEDDGRGLNLEKIKKKAIDNGIYTAEALEVLPHQELMQLIFHPGFSTAEAVTSVSGRGVGMDVVKTNIHNMGGSVELFSETGKGSQFYIKIPLTLAIVSILIVEAEDQRFAMPQVNIKEIVTIGDENGYRIEDMNGAQILRLRGDLLPLVSLSQILGLDQTKCSLENPCIVVCSSGTQSFGLIVDRVHDTEEIVVKPVSYLIKDFPFFSGNTILGDGQVIMILDPTGLAQVIPKPALQSYGEGAESLEGSSALKSDDDIGFILFKDHQSKPKVVPLELVCRIESIDVNQIERIGDMLTMQYRQGIMQIVTLENAPQIPDAGVVNLIVIQYESKDVGLLVNVIDDIVYTQYDIKFSPSSPSSLGSLILNGVTTEILDVYYVLEQNVSLVRPGPESSAVTSMTPLKLLLVEDSPLFSNLTEQFLSDYGYAITKASNGSEALAILYKDPNAFIGVVTDIDMPVMDGCALTLLCRNTPEFAHLPIIAYTGFWDKDTSTKFDHVGFTACVAKTDRMGLLDAIQRNVLDMAVVMENDANQALQNGQDSQEVQLTYVTFYIQNQYFALPVDWVRDIIQEVHLPPFPKIADEISSFINLRGRVVTVLNMKIILQCPTRTYENPMLIILEYKGEQFGLLVDRVEKVCSLIAEHFEEAPPHLSERWSGIISGVYSLEYDILAIMDIDALFGAMTEEAFGGNWYSAC